MIKVDWSVFMQIANFLFLVFAMNVVLYKPIRKILADRKEKIAGLEKGIEDSDSGVLDRENAFKAGVKQARAEGLKKKDELLAAIAEEEKQMIAQINEKAKADLFKVREQISLETESVRAKLKEEADVFAEAISEKILGRTV